MQSSSVGSPRTLFQPTPTACTLGRVRSRSSAASLTASVRSYPPLIADLASTPCEGRGAPSPRYVSSRRYCWRKC